MAEDFAILQHQGMWALPTEELDRLTEICAKTDPMISHEVFHTMCKELYAQVSPRARSENSREISEKGFQRIPSLLSNETCDELSQKMTDWSRSLSDRPSDFESSQRHEVELREKIGEFHWQDILTPDSELLYVKSLVEKILRPDFVQVIEDALQSYFRLDHYLLSRTFPSDKLGGSFLWHRDGAPRAQLHLMVYLTDSKPDQSGGATSFLPKVQSERVAERGYVYVAPTHRTEDLSTLNPEVVPFRETPQMKAGDGLLFFSSLVLHRGIPPLTNHRDVLTLVLLPDLNPWYKSLNKWGFERLKARGFGDTTLYRHPAAV